MKSQTGKYRVGHGGYVSEFEQFIDTYLAQHPEVKEDQQRGWYIWWDHRIDLDELDKQRRESIPVKPYGYE